jgi:hypothetical protein
MKVLNCDIDTKKVCQCGNWLAHWTINTRGIVRMCVVKDCCNFDLAGSHVQKADSDDQEIYIIPLCKEHAASTEVLEIFNDVTLVSADVKKTCRTNASTVVKEGER